MLELLHLRLGAALFVVAALIVSLPFLALLLRVLARRGLIPSVRNAHQNSRRTDLLYMLLAPFTNVASRVLTTLGIAGCALLIDHHVGPELLSGFGPVIEQPRWLLLVEMLVLSDFVYYWTHRLAHSVPMLWRLHAVHHSSQHLSWTSALRAHPAEIYVHLVNVLPLFLLGFPVDALLPLAPIITLYALLIHTNFDVSLRALSFVVNTPNYHGWHHALDVRNGTVNYAGFFPIFDKLFGTYSLPAARPSELGIDDASMPEACLAQLRHSFRPAAVERRSTRAPTWRCCAAVGGGLARARAETLQKPYS